LRRLFIRPPSNLRAHYAPLRQGQQAGELFTGAMHRTDRDEIQM
jgi:hypothetical protein